ncbi:hypothetical protein HMPREF1318_0910 [Actinomyces massiliensis F0489]|uniref:Uncharacterized protein n=1 Tax=Actinomyces massiliensis F0489 TaxID=1125718 RepID=J0WKK9_9ACTO|nr:hypothetical protein HMPREF1318_0910 [Actinomyces massiliensis F0489]
MPQSTAATRVMVGFSWVGSGAQRDLSTSTEQDPTNRAR